LQQRLNREMEQYTKLLQEHRLDVVSRTLAHLETIGHKFAAFIGWVIGEVNVDNQGRIIAEGPLSNAHHRAFIQLWMLGWQAKQGHLRLRTIVELDLRGMGVVEFPSTMKYLTNLRRLRLEDNPVYSLWPTIEWVSIDHQQIHRFAWICKKLDSPPQLAVDFSGYLGDESIIWGSLQELPNIVSVQLNHPAVEVVPSWIRNLSALRHLDLKGCRINQLPDWIGELKHLEMLDLGCQLHQQKIILTSALGRLQKLRILGLSELNLSSLPAWMSSLSLLEVLYLDGNRLSSLPDWLEKLSKIRVLWLTGNPILKFPAVLQSLPQLEQVALHLLLDRSGHSQQFIAERLRLWSSEIQILRYRSKYWRCQNQITQR